MNKPYTKEMWEEYKKQASHEFLISSQKEDRKSRGENILQLIVVIMLSLLLYFLPDIMYYKFQPNLFVNKEEEIQKIRDLTLKLLDSKEVKSGDVIYLADLYRGKYSYTLKPVFSHTKYPYQCMGYIEILTNEEIIFEHYCDMFE